MATRRRLGRDAIDVLKAAYLDGREFEGVHDVRAFLVRALGIKPARVPVTAAGEWDRQARYELADQHVAVTSPVGVNRYRRIAGADQAARTESRDVRFRDLRTRLVNQKRLAAADAAQADASRVEIERNVRLDIALEIVGGLLTIED